MFIIYTIYLDQNFSLTYSLRRNKMAILPELLYIHYQGMFFNVTQKFSDPILSKVMYSFWLPLTGRLIVFDCTFKYFYKMLKVSNHVEDTFL